MPRIVHLLLLLLVTNFLAGTGFGAGLSAVAGKPDGSGWTAILSDYDSAPSRVIAVGKTSQRIFLFERHSPLLKTAEYPCTTGQVGGDKQARGDLKTPEGVYFVTQRLASGLDFVLYGNEAYTLNYPNPVDRLRKKTGYGIWIHGKGVPLVPRDTRGCVAMNNEDIAVLGGVLTPGTPVALAENIVHGAAASPEEQRVARLLREKVYAWATAWASRSTALFDYYNPTAYTLAQGEPFSSFRRQKEWLFKSLPWIENKISNVHVLPGPGYWVTWFHQEYHAPNLSTSGVRRLYWQEDVNGELRIVGMEWEPGLEHGLLLAERAPQSLPLPTSEEDTNGTDGLPSSPLVAAAARDVPTQPAGPAPAMLEKTAQPEKPKAESAEERKARLEREGLAFVEHWRAAWERGDLKAYSACYNLKARQGERKGIAAISAHKARLWGAVPPAKVQLEKISLSLTSSGLKISMQQIYSDKSGYSDHGLKTLWLEPSSKGLQISREEWNAEQP